MPLTVNIIKRNKMMNEYFVVADVTFDSSYATGGEALGPADFGLSQLDWVAAGHGSGYIFDFDLTNNKLKAYSAATTEVTNATDLHLIVVRVAGIGT